MSGLDRAIRDVARGWTPASTALAAALVLAIYNLAPLALGTEALLERVPDDAFYYLVLSRNFLETGRWTFDGIAPASGFHILFAYIVAGLYGLWPEAGLETVYAVVVLLNTVLVATAVYLLSRVAERLGFGSGLAGVLLVAISAVGVRLPGFPMESGLVVFFSAAAFYVAAGLVPRHRAVAIAFVVGVLGVLSRSDWGAMPFALLAASLAHMWWHSTFDRHTLTVLLALCAGAIAGEVIVALHTHHFTGGFVQKSGAVKHFWASHQGYTPLPGMARVVELLGPGGVPRAATLLAALVACGGILFRRDWRRLIDNALVPAAVLIIAGYIFVYSLNGAVQYWYAASFFAAVAILSAAAWSALPARLTWVKNTAVAVFLAGAVYQLANPPWTWAPAMREAGLYLRQQPEIAPVGAWNAGIISYFSGRSLTNLDGLVNDEIYPNLVAGSLARYIHERGIRYLVDFPDIFSDVGAIKGGFPDGRLPTCIRALKSFRSDRPFAGTSLTLFEVDQVCIAAAARVPGESTP